MTMPLWHRPSENLETKQEKIMSEISLSIIIPGQVYYSMSQDEWLTAQVKIHSQFQTNYIVFYETAA